MAQRKTVNKARGKRIEKLVNEWFEERYKGLKGNKSELARELGIKRGALYRWMEGYEMEIWHLERLCEFFSTTPGWILSQTGPMHVTSQFVDAEAETIAEAEERQAAASDRSRRRQA